MKYEIKNNEITELIVKKSNRRKIMRICLAFAAAGILIFFVRGQVSASDDTNGCK